MSAGPCEKFQANFFNRAKCQNCFKSRELHVPARPPMEHAKAVYAGWLCLAPEGTEFDKAAHRSRKWQRRFFVLYEDGVVTFALDELPSTLPHGMLDMNTCTAILDPELRTGLKNSLCIVTMEKEVYVRADNKDAISGWSDQLAVFVQGDANNLKKKRKVDAASVPEPSPAKMAAPDPTFQAPLMAGGGHLQEDQQVERNPVWTVTGSDLANPEHTLATDSHACDVGDTHSTCGRLHPDRDPTEQETESIQTCADNMDANQLSCDVPAGKRPMSGEASGMQREERTRSSRRGRSDARPSEREPDLLNFKKGWLVKLDDDAQWRKFWFVLSADSLKFYKDTMAEEALEQEGEVDLSECFKVSEQQVQKNYGFQIHTPNGTCTLSAMTAGIRRNWVQALVKNVHTAPTVTGLSGSVAVLSPNLESSVKPDVTPDWSEPDRRSEPRSVLERRREGRYKTFDWADFQPPGRSAADVGGSPPPPLCRELEKKRRREARRRRYESILGLSPGREVMGDAAGPASLRDEMEACWKQVERNNSMKSARILHINHDNNAADSVHDYKKAFEDLKRQLELSERGRQELEARLSSCTYRATATLECLQRSGDGGHSLGEITGSRIPEHQLQHLDNDKDTPATWACDTDEDLLPLRCESLASTASDSSDLQTMGEAQNEPVDLEDFIGDRLEIPRKDSPPCPDSIGDCRSSTLDALAEAGGDQATVMKLSQEVEILGGQKEALDQRNQEMLNQLSEADREIQRLKEELSLRCTEQLPKQMEDLQQELQEKDLQLLQAQTLITSLENRLGDAEEDEPSVGNAEVASVGNTEGSLLRCFQATEAKLTELERKLHQSEFSCRQLQAENEALKEAGKLHRQNATQTEADFSRPAPADRRTQQMLEWTMLRWKVLDRFLQVVDRLDVMKTKMGNEEEAGHPVTSCQLKLEELWSALLDDVNANASRTQEQNEEILNDVARQMIPENQMLLLGGTLLTEDDKSSAGLDRKHKENIQDVLGNTQCVSAPESGRMSDDTKHLSALDDSGVEFLGMIVQIISSWINVMSSSLRDKVGMTAEHLRATFIFSTEAAFCFRMTSKCNGLLEENTELRRRLSQAEKQTANVDAGSQAEQEAEEGEEVTRRQEAAQVAALTGRVTDLEEQLSTTRQKLTSDQMQHDEEVQNIKAQCELSLAAMEDCHMKAAEELQRQHLQEVEFLLAERDRKLEEEAVATATAVEAIERAHRVELGKEVQRRYQTLNVTGNALMEEVYKQHSEELASCQQELVDLSYRFTLKCVEIAHMTQELDAQRETLSQRRQENQDLMDQNQELSTHLVAEAGRLTQQEVLPNNKGANVYKMELLLRVKESQLQSVRRQVAALQDKLQAAQKVKVDLTDD
ncbi:myosin phosphatase Rho-interacting protein-like isoform X2 [Phyllopteryx taeniolatus]|uniref:myosin phosphatase Rho-interacting protein-like isoform X2 n=1 Tax=Phyllopteryx taeniolatus TaxID=161469 RepID=UPI002AD1D4FD|nr:myosin phosphatase Rho-interacting protein-like isoform X2 [Phyllopteryx taeniolatus]